MKLVSLFVLGVMAVSTNALAQAPAAAIERALLAAPARMSEDATVIRWKPDHTYETLRKGTNRLVCYDKSGFPLERPFSIECTSIGNLDRVAQNLKFEKAGGDRPKTQALVRAAEEDGTRVKPEYGSMFYNFRGDDHSGASRHTTISVPGATSQSTGLPDTRDQGGAWIMGAGTMSAHIMLPLP